MLGRCLALEFGSWDWVWNLGGGGGRAWMTTVRQRHARHGNLVGFFTKGSITGNSKYPSTRMRIEQYPIKTVPEQPRSTPP